MRNQAKSFTFRQNIQPQGAQRFLVIERLRNENEDKTKTHD